MNDNQMASDIKWHRLDDMDDSTYPNKVGELYLVRIYTRDKGHHYSIARLLDADEYKKVHSIKSVSSNKYIFVSDDTGSAFKRKSDGSGYIDGWNDLLFASISNRSSGSNSSTNSKVWIDLRNRGSVKRRDK